MSIWAIPLKSKSEAFACKLLQMECYVSIQIYVTMETKTSNRK